MDAELSLNLGRSAGAPTGDASPERMAADGWRALRPNLEPRRGQVLLCWEQPLEGGDRLRVQTRMYARPDPGLAPEDSRIWQASRIGRQDAEREAGEIILGSDRGLPGMTLREAADVALSLPVLVPGVTVFAASLGDLSASVAKAARAMERWHALQANDSVAREEAGSDADPMPGASRR